MGAGHSHSHDHGHGHGHAHSHAPADFGNAFLIGIVLNTAFVVVEATYGWVSGSMALIADAGHNLSDVLALLLAWGASVAAKRPASQRFSNARSNHADRRSASQSCRSGAQLCLYV